MSSKCYTEEFKIEAAKQVTNRVHSVADVSVRLDVSIHSLYAWIKRYSVTPQERQTQDSQQDELRRLREAQHQVAQCSESGTASTETKTPGRVLLADFLTSLGTAWQDGEVRPTHHRKTRVAHTWRSREDPFEHTWPTIQQWLETEPGITAKKLHERLIAMAPAMYSSAQLRTLQRRVKAWRSNRAKELVARVLSEGDRMKAGTATLCPPSSQNNRTVTNTRG